MAERNSTEALGGSSGSPLGSRSDKGLMPNVSKQGLLIAKWVLLITLCVVTGLLVVGGSTGSASTGSFPSAAGATAAGTCAFAGVGTTAVHEVLAALGLPWRTELDKSAWTVDMVTVAMGGKVIFMPPCLCCVENYQ